MKLYRIEDNMQVSQACPDPPFKAGKDRSFSTQNKSAGRAISLCRGRHFQSGAIAPDIITQLRTT